MKSIKSINAGYMAAIFFVTGIMLIVTSIYGNLPFILLTGFCFIFWSFILFYVRPIRYVRLSTLNIAIESISINIESLIKESKSSEKGIYLAPNKLADINKSVVFIPNSAQTLLPEVLEINDNLFSKRNDGLFLIPPGYLLSRMFEQEMNVSFTKQDLPFFEENISNLLIQKLEFANKVEIQREGSKISLSLYNSIFEEACESTKKYQRTHSQVGCILSSAFACVLAKCSGKSVIITNENTTSRNMFIELVMLDE